MYAALPPHHARTPSGGEPNDCFELAGQAQSLWIRVAPGLVPHVECSPVQLL